MECARCMLLLVTGFSHLAAPHIGPALSAAWQVGRAPCAVVMHSKRQEPHAAVARSGERAPRRRRQGGSGAPGMLASGRQLPALGPGTRRCTPPRCPCTTSSSSPAMMEPTATWTRVRAKRRRRLLRAEGSGDRLQRGTAASSESRQRLALPGRIIGAASAARDQMHAVPAAACLRCRHGWRPRSPCLAPLSPGCLGHAPLQRATPSTLMTLSPSCWSWCWRWWGISGTRACCAPPCSSCCTSRWGTCR